ncbi:MAG: hypothetical protein ABFD24_06205 [Anaerolineaceae bacterium]
MKIEELEIPMPNQYKELLLTFVRKSKEQKNLNGVYDYNLVGRMFVRIGEEFLEYSGIHGNPFLSFQAIGLIQAIEGPGGNFVFMPLAFKWYEYHTKSDIGKWFIRFFDRSRDVLIAISFILSLALTILDIVRAIK